MKSYPEFKQLDLTAIDQEVLQFWQTEAIFEKSIDNRKDADTYVFYEGPPSANGKPGIHHVMARTIKDLFCRFHTMLGKRVDRKGGWDTHGLPIELKVEQELGITKEDIGKKVSVDAYNAKCKETVMRYKDLWDDITQKMGYWVDLDNPYITFENEYIESVWYLLKRLYDKGLLYKGYTIQPYSPAAGTGLSSHELNMPGAYKEVKDTSVVAQFKVIKNATSEFLFEQMEDEELYVIAWTTTPWTLPSNTALAVGAKIEYLRVKTYNPYTKKPLRLILAKDLLGKWFKPEQAELDYDAFEPDQKLIPYLIEAHYKGSQFEGIRYEQLLPYVQPKKGDAFKVLLGDFVSTEDGTGIVHLAPSFGADDKRVAEQYGVGALTLVDLQGKFVDEVSDFAGRYVKNYKDEESYVAADIDIAIKLKQENKAFNVQKYSHNYPHCWRTDKPVLYYPLDSWFIKSTAKKAQMVALNKTINWKPSHTGEKRFGNWLENLQDWNLSRSRYWGTPLPIWRTADGKSEICIGSIAELESEIEKANASLGLEQSIPKDLHRPYIDEVILVSADGRPMKRELDLIDVWFDSGSMPYAQWHYPFENKDKFKENYPADFIAEGVDQTRGWFFTLHAIAAMAYDSVAFKNVVSNGLVQDKNGQKMSKRLGNAVDPFETLGKYGADATRWYMISNAQPWDNLKFDYAGLEEVRRKFFGTLYNTYAFYALYTNIDSFDNKEDQIPLADRPIIDQWIISSLHSLIALVKADYADYEPTNACRRIQSFVDAQLSNWYVRLCRRRFWKGEMSVDKKAAYQTLYACLDTLAHLMAPVAPFFSDWLYQNLNNTSDQHPYPSVHLSNFPVSNAGFIDKALEERMDYAQRISSLVLSLRKKSKIRVRQPLSKIILPVINSNFESQVNEVKDLILSEVNVKSIDFITEDDSLLQKQIKPNFKTLGKRLGKDMKAAAQAIATIDQAGISAIEKEGYKLLVGQNSYALDASDFEITYKDIPGMQVANDNELVVALDVNITEDLQLEGIARELINRIQNIRKNSDFEVTDRIAVQLYADDDRVLKSVHSFGPYIKNEVLADSLKAENDFEAEKINLLDGLDVKIAVALHHY